MNKSFIEKSIAGAEIILGALIAILPFFLLGNAVLWAESILGILVLIGGFILTQCD